ncbi:hypothetical protein Ccrd_020111 [Cynara cardunculus var. scolymus]|uniref:Uncharacterized protein n=1 Tax=Cynara cardunculus var. scolymus TaxID=59895 RepID=A0A103Y316_CYNCS|nr:hypothetical protein Ccrd_020111 [Cynara cardunculus var. scolymus]
MEESMHLKTRKSRKPNHHLKFSNPLPSFQNENLENFEKSCKNRRLEKVSKHRLLSNSISCVLSDEELVKLSKIPSPKALDTSKFNMGWGFGATSGKDVEEENIGMLALPYVISNPKLQSNVQCIEDSGQCLNIAPSFVSGKVDDIVANQDDLHNFVPVKDVCHNPVVQTLHEKYTGLHEKMSWFAVSASKSQMEWKKVLRLLLVLRPPMALPPLDLAILFLFLKAPSFSHMELPPLLKTLLVCEVNIHPKLPREVCKGDDETVTCLNPKPLMHGTWVESLEELAIDLEKLVAILELKASGEAQKVDKDFPFQSYQKGISFQEGLTVDYAPSNLLDTFSHELKYVSQKRCHSLLQV